MTRERRHGLRQTTRLRPGKLLGPTDDFLCDCAVVERSILGARIRAFAPVERVVPETITLYDEVEERRFEARVVWARGAEMGCRSSAAARRSRRPSATGSPDSSTPSETRPPPRAATWKGPPRSLGAGLSVCGSRVLLAVTRRAPR